MTRIVLTSMALVAGFTMFETASAEPPSDSKTTSLFNGKDLTGWHVDVPHLDKNPDAKGTFVVRDGMLVSFGQPGGHLITDAK